MPAVGVILISGTALLGWWTDHAALAAYLPGIANMTFNTALCFMLAALACCISSKKGIQSSASIRLGVGLFIGLFAIVTRLQDISGLNFGIDNLLFDSHGYGLLSPYPGRMSPLTATGFFLIGIIFFLLSMHHSRPYRFISITHALIILLGIIGLAGFSMNVLTTLVAAETYAHLASISLFTALSFLLLAIAIMIILQQRHQEKGLSLLLHSGVQLMYRLKYPQKFALISAVLLVPIAMLMWNEIKQAEHDVADARLKITGIEHIRLNVELLKAIPEHRGMVNARFSNSDLFRQTIAQKVEQIDQLLNANTIMDQSHGGQLSIPEAWSGVISRWAAIKENRSDRLLQWQLHSEIIALITRHLRNVGDESGLTFDDNPFLHNLLTAQMKEMPELLEQIGQMRGQGTGLILRKNITRSEQLMFVGMISRADHYQKELQRLLGNASNNQDTQHLAQLHSTMIEKIRRFIATSEREFIANSNFSIPAEVYIKQEAYFQQATDVIDQGYKLYSASLAYVEQQLHQRINDRVITQYSIKFSALLLAAVLLFLFASFYKSVMNTIRALDSTANRMRNGDANELAMLPASDELGDVVGSFNTIAEELIRVNSHMRAVVNHAIDGIISIDDEGIVKSFNPASEHIFGYKADEVLGQNITMLMPEVYRERHLTGLQHYCETGEGQVLGRPTEVQGLRKDGEEFPMELSINVMLIDNRQMFIGMVRDASEHQKMELQLRHAQKMEAVGALIGGVAHNFNNLLAGIVGRAYLVRRNIHKQPEKTLYHIESIEAISAQAGDIVKQLLTFAYKDFFHDKKKAVLAVLIKEGYKTARLGIAEDIDLALNVTAPEAMVVCDTNQIQQVLMNMMNNARDAVAGCAKKSISVSLDVRRPDAEFFYRHPELAAGEYACLQVTDSGRGMDSETVEKIFEPFYTTKGVGKGTGLGLSSAFGSIASHDGVIEVDSKPGSGTTFRVYLPVAEAIETEIEADSKQPVISSSGHETILLVDDEPVILHSIQEVLEELGYKVLTACNGAEGLACFQQHQHSIDGVITDVVMPHMGGVEMFRQIRSINATIPTIFLTGYDQGKVQLQADEKENTSIASKPIQVPELSRLVKQFLKQ